MGYACPVCDAPQADGEHLANHLAFTALLHGGEHEDWLAERVTDWVERDPASLATAVVEDAPETDEEPVSSDPVQEDLLIDHQGRERTGVETLDAETRRAIEDARELTREHRAERTEE